MQLNQLREDLDEAVKVQDFEKANTIKTQVAELDAEKARLLETTETVTEEVRTERVSVSCQDFEKANTIKTQVAELDAEKARLLETTETATEEVRTERVGI